MKNKTNISKLKEISNLLLDYPIKATGSFMGDFFLQHPIFNSRIVSKSVPKTKENPVGLEMIDILLEENQEEARNLYRNAINKCNKAQDFFMIINKPYFGIFFKLVEGYLSIEDYTNMLEHTWVSMEFPNTDSNVSKYEWIKYWKNADNSLIYSKEDIEKLSTLPDEFYVYRGLMKKAKVQALSWTLDLDKAVWFAKRFKNEGKVYRGLCRKKDILVYLSSRNEEEIVVDWRKLREIEEIKYEEDR